MCNGWFGCLLSGIFAPIANLVNEYHCLPHTALQTCRDSALDLPVGVSRYLFYMAPSTDCLHDILHIGSDSEVTGGSVGYMQCFFHVLSMNTGIPDKKPPVPPQLTMRCAM